MICPEHGFERFRIKIVKKFNMESDRIEPKFRSRPRSGGLSCVYIGRDVSEREIRSFLIEHFRSKGMWERVLSMKFKPV